MIGLGESNMIHACSLDRKIGFVTINPVFISWHENQINYYGLQQRISAVSAVDTQVQDFEQAFTEQIKPMIVQGVEVIVLAGPTYTC